MGLFPVPFLIYNMISESKFQEVANSLGVEPNVLKAVSIVESKGEGFLPDGQPKILFEPHRFWANLVKNGIDPNKYTKGNEDILYKKWGSKPYGKYSEQHSRLQRASKIDRDAALESASWGMFQVMGENWKSLGYNSLQEFINDAYKNEDAHFEMFIRFIKANNLIKYLKTKEWTKFASGYNGPGYKENNYDEKMKKEYQILTSMNSSE